MKKSERKENLMPSGIPKWLRIYDNQGKTFDRYTVIFTHAQSFNMKGFVPVLCMSENPFHPQGFCQHQEYKEPIDKPSYKHLGKKIKFQELPKDCQRAVIQDYTDYWSLE